MKASSVMSCCLGCMSFPHCLMGSTCDKVHNKLDTQCPSQIMVLLTFAVVTQNLATSAEDKHDTCRQQAELAQEVLCQAA